MSEIDDWNYGRGRVPSPRRELKSLPWFDCPCGCKSHVVKVGEVEYGIYRIREGHYSLHAGHGQRGVILGHHKSFDKADAAARKDAAPHFRELQKHMEVLAKSFPA
jgi:hypothetical protein